MIKFYIKNVLEKIDLQKNRLNLPFIFVILQIIPPKFVSLFQFTIYETLNTKVSTRKFIHMNLPIGLIHNYIYTKWVSSSQRDDFIVNTFIFNTDSFFYFFYARKNAFISVTDV